MGIYHIVYVDDEESLLEIGKAFLEKDRDLKVSTSTSAKEVLGVVLEDNPFDLIISDYQMPEMDGIEFLKEVRNSSARNLPFIIFTGKGREEIIIEAINSGASFYMQKGGDVKAQYAELLHKSKEAIKKRGLEDRLRKIQELSLRIVSGAGTMDDNLMLIIATIQELLRVSGVSISLVKGGHICHHIGAGTGKNLKESVGDLNQLFGKRLLQAQKACMREEKVPPLIIGGRTMNSVMGAPIQYRGATFGVIYVFDFKEDCFSEEDLEMVSLFGNLAAIETMSINFKNYLSIR